MKKYLIGLVILFLVIGALSVFLYLKENKRYPTVSDAIDDRANGNVILHTESIDRFTLYFYQPKDEPILFDYIYQSKDGYKASTKSIDKKANTLHQVIWHYQERNGEHLVVISQCLYNKTPFTITDNQSSNFQTISFDYEGTEFTYYVSHFESHSNSYKLYIDGEDVLDWENKKFKWFL